jgi:hypothetical protein
MKLTSYEEDSILTALSKHIAQLRAGLDVVTMRATLLDAEDCSRASWWIRELLIAQRAKAKLLGASWS